jgi:polyisoprenyl-phosphate glycosyltransferase
LVIKITTERAISGWTSMIVAISFLGGIQLICMGILGLYISRINKESKRRPLYIVRDFLEK